MSVVWSRRGLRVAALALVLALVLAVVAPQSPRAQDAATVFRFEGVVHPSRRAQIDNRVDGVIVEARISGGEAVAAGDVLFRLDPTRYEIAVARARAALEAAEARLALDEDAATRQAALLDRGAGAEAAATQARLQADISRAARAQSAAELQAAELDLAWTEIRAPISGVAARPSAALGAFVEAESGAPLGEILALDPALVAYRAPIESRLAALQAAGAEDPAALFERLTLILELPSGEDYAHAGRPSFESVAADEAAGALTTWGLFPNPGRTLTPGMRVRVRSVLDAEPGAAEQSQ